MTVLDLDTAKAWLGYGPTAVVDDAEIQDVLDAAVAAIACKVGPLEPTPVTSTIDITGAGGSGLLPVLPVLAVTQAVNTWTGQTLTVPAVTASRAGVLAGPRGAGLPPGSWVVTYSAGRDTLPDDLLMAVKEMVRHLNAPRRPRGGKIGPGSTPDSAAAGTAHLLPWRVAELIEDHLILAGFA